MAVSGMSLSRERTNDDVTGLENDDNGRPADASLFVSDLDNYVAPAQLDESNMVDPSPLPVQVAPEIEAPVTYAVVEASTERGKDCLLDSLGYQYTLKVDKRLQNVTWMCASRAKPHECKATVREHNESYIRGPHHVCPAQPGKVRVAEVRREIKAIAGKRVFDFAAEIVDDVLRERVGADDIPIHPSLPCPLNLAVQANRKCCMLRPQEPRNLGFNIDEDHIAPGFLQHDRVVGNFRHPVFATQAMLSLLCCARTWYVDATFKLVKEPFVQLFSIHAFVKSGTSHKQVPLVFVMMGSRRINDYMSVFRAVLEHLPDDIALRHVVADYEAAKWQALRTLLPAVEIKGCLFHFTQAVFRKIKEHGLQVAYSSDPALTNLAEYVRTTLIGGNIFTPRD